MTALREAALLAGSIALAILAVLAVCSASAPEPKGRVTSNGRPRRVW